MKKVDYKNLTEEELKEEFLKYFTLKDWDASDRCSELDIINKMIKELGAKEVMPLDTSMIHDKMKALFEENLKGNLNYKSYKDEQNNLTKLLLDNEINKRNLNHQTLTMYSLSNKIIRYLNSINIKEDDHLRFIRENVSEVFYSLETKETKFVYSFMKN